MDDSVSNESAGMEVIDVKNSQKTKHNHSFVSTYCGCSQHSDSVSWPSMPTGASDPFQKEKLKTFMTFVVFLLTILLNHFILAVISEVIIREPLPDLMHSLMPQDITSLHMADVFASMSCVMTVILIVILHVHRWIVARRLLYLFSVLFLMRAVSITVTHIPPSYANSAQICEKPSDQVDPSILYILGNFWRITSTLGLQVTDSNGVLFCGDMLFSGHTTTLSTCCFFLNYYLPHSLWPVKLIVISCCGIAMLCLIFSRAHYSVDVIMGYWISSIIFSLYHAFCELPHDVRPSIRSFRRLFIFWTMFETERRVPAGRLPNKLQWPLPWPKVMVEFMDDWSLQNEGTRAGSIARWLSEHRLKFHM